MSFILRIFFSGLIAFIPSEDGKELTVLLLDATHAHHAGAAVPEHKPVLLARAQHCGGACPKSDVTVSSFLYPDAASGAAAVDSLAHALSQGAVWQLAGSDISLGTANDGVRLIRTAMLDDKAVPDTAAERTDFGWVANLKKIDPFMGEIDQSVFSGTPPEGLIVARLKLTSGEVSTRSIIQVNGKAVPIDFRPPTGQESGYTRAVASWVQGEISVPGDSLQVVETTFAGIEKRRMSLRPLDGVVEIAVLNISSPVPPRRDEPPQPGVHFGRFWDLAANPRSAEQRPIPQLARSSVAQRDWDALHPDQPDSSPLLQKIFLHDRGPYDQILCPMAQRP